MVSFYSKGLFVVMGLLLLTFASFDWAEARSSSDVLLSPGVSGYSSFTDFVLNFSPLMFGILIVGAVVFMVLMAVEES